jgi:hypothetical protein
MNKYLLLTAACGLAFTALYAASPTFKSTSANGNAASPAAVILPADPYSQVRVLSVVYSTDTNNSSLSCTYGTTAFSITATNATTTAITNRISGTNGLTPSCVLVLQHAGVGYAATVASWNQDTNTASGSGTNIVLASGAWGVATTVGDSVYLMSSATLLPAAAAASGSTTTASKDGEAIYVAGLSGRPVRIVLTPALGTNQLNNVVYHYD